MSDIKTHFMVGPKPETTTEEQTLCGKKGWRTDWQGEYDTAIDERFHGTRDRNGVTCKRCLRSLGAPR